MADTVDRYGFDAAVTPPPRDPYLGQVLGDRYRITRVIGAGGMATVYAAQHTLIGRNVAVKMLHSQYARDQGCVKRFFNEGRAAGTLGHPHIVASTDMGFAPDGTPFLVLELLQGVSLAVELARKGAFPIKRAARIGLQVASAVQAAHDHGIIHRDLKPENVFLLPTEDGGDHAKVLDFGISKFLTGSASYATQQGALMGTPDFMAPEQISAPDTIDRRIDIYALGVIVYVMLSGRAPFAETPFPKILSRIETDQPPDLRQFRRNVPPELVTVVQRAMAKSPTERYQNVAELVTALTPFAGASLAAIIATRHSTPGQLLAGVTDPTPASFSDRAVTPGSQPRPSAMDPTLVAHDSALLASQQTPMPVVPPRSRWTGIVAVLALLAAGGALAAMVLRSDPDGPIAAAAQPTGAEEPAQPPSGDLALTTYLDEAERLAGERRYTAALAVLERARAVDCDTPELNIRLARVTDDLEIGTLREAAQRSLADGDNQAAATAAKQILDRRPDDDGALAIITQLNQAQPAQPPEQARKQGAITVKSNPRATVYVDDVPIGRTPISGYSVAAGKHKVELRSSGYRDARRRITVGARKTKRISVKLEPAAPERGAPLAISGKAAPEPAEVARPAPASARAEPTTAVRRPSEGSTTSPTSPKASAPPRDTAATGQVARPRLPATHKVNSINELGRALRIIEKEAIARGGVATSVANGVTTPLAQAIFEKFAPGKIITLRPRDMYYLIVNNARAGKSRSAIGSKIKSAQLANSM